MNSIDFFKALDKAKEAGYDINTMTVATFAKWVEALEEVAWLDEDNAPENVTVHTNKYEEG